MKNRNHLIQCIVASILVLTSPIAVFGLAWEQSEESGFFSAGDVAAVKRILKDNQEAYSGELLIEALETAILGNGAESNDLVKGRNVELVKYLATLGWLEECRKSPKCHTVDYAAYNVKMLRYLVSEGFPVTVETLGLALNAGNIESVRFLCEKGVNSGELLNSSPYYNETEKWGVMDWGTNGGLDEWGECDPLVEARESAAKVKAAEYLKSGQCRQGSRDSAIIDSYALEIKAIRDADIGLVRKLFARRDSAAMHPYVHVYLLYEAVASGSIELLRYFKSIGWTERCRRIEFCNPAVAAAKAGADDNVFEFLISEGFELDRYNRNYGTPLHYAALSGHLNAVKFLCLHGADYRKRINSDGERSILNRLQQSYGQAWCALNAKSKGAGEICDDEGGNAQECIPGSTCRSVRFPPDGPQKDVQRIVGLSNVFRYLKDGHCKSAQTEKCPPIPELKINNGQRKGTVIDEKINLRNAPDLSGEIVGTLKYGDRITIFEGKSDCVTISGRIGHWVKVSAEEIKKEGWVFDAYVDYYGY